ncbi:hypothetical protein N431DRAFT_454923 [Stipitochalara longipes BDJ]|nr:hypothetical protein N431DRAFT_454923 [Stipitochalara longipes BDJ]
MKNISPLLSVLFITAAGAFFSADNLLQLNCTNQQPVFILQRIFYDYEEVYDSPTHLVYKEATISFNLANTAVQYITSCSASIAEYDFGSNITYQCSTPSNATAGSSANFTLSGRTGSYAVNQTWVCGKLWHYGGNALGLPGKRDRE